MSKKKIVTIGGGTGTFVVLSGLKEYKDIIDISAIVTVTDLPYDGSVFLYSDVIPFLKKYKDKHLILVSTTTYSSQKKVVTDTGILDYLKEIYFVDTNNEKGDVLSKYNEKIVFLDDLPENLYNVQNKCKNSTVVLMDRNKTANNRDFPVVSSLLEFEKYI